MFFVYTKPYYPLRNLKLFAVDYSSERGCVKEKHSAFLLRNKEEVSTDGKPLLFLFRCCSFIRERLRELVTDGAKLFCGYRYNLLNIFIAL